MRRPAMLRTASGSTSRSACHGRNGQGGAYTYPAPPLAQLEMPIEAFQALLRDAPNDMPSFPVSVVSDTDAADVLAFLRSLPGLSRSMTFRC
jgi:mono/diheme cytochrome c family protein